MADPSPNVLDLVNAAIQRQDDLRTMEAGYVEQIGRMREERATYVADMRSGYIAQIGDMRESHARYITELRAQYGTELRLAETARIDAIRAVDVGAAATLATQVAASAEALRGQVEAARQQTAATLAAALEPIQKDIQDLRRAQYEAQGQKIQTVETGTESRDEIMLRQAQIQAAAQRTQVYALVIAAIVLGLAIYAAFHK